MIIIQNCQIFQQFSINLVIVLLNNEILDTMNYSNESVNNNYIIKEESSVYTVESRSRNNTKLPIINNRSQHYQPINQFKQNDMRSYYF